MYRCGFICRIFFLLSGRLWFRDFYDNVKLLNNQFGLWWMEFWVGFDGIGDLEWSHLEIIVMENQWKTSWKLNFVWGGFNGHKFTARALWNSPFQFKNPKNASHFQITFILKKNLCSKSQRLTHFWFFLHKKNNIKIPLHASDVSIVIILIYTGRKTKLKLFS